MEDIIENQQVVKRNCPPENNPDDYLKPFLGVVLAENIAREILKRTFGKIYSAEIDSKLATFSLINTNRLINDFVHLADYTKDTGETIAAAAETGHDWADLLENVCFFCETWNPKKI